jgi:hypothetical protein
LLTDTFKMLNMDYKSRIKYYKNLRNMNEAKVYNMKHVLPTKDEKINFLKQHMKMRDQYEASVMGAYFLAFPSKVKC